MALRRLVNDRRVRAAAAQAAVVAGLIGIVWYFVANAADALVKSGIASGFDFFGRASGIEVPMHLVSHTTAHSFANLLLVGFLNTVLVSALGIVAATILGFAVGLARLSSNAVLSALAGAFIEFVRNIPLLLFVFFWYFGIVRALPAPRASVNLGDLVFLNNRGVYMPAPESWTPFLTIPAALALGIVLAWAIARWSRDRREATGEAPPTGGLSALAVIGLPVLATLWAAMTVAWEVPALRGLNYRGGAVLIPEFVALFAALTTYTAGFIAEIVRGGIL
ncbi:MAG: ABC transporter permease subunit, partial [Alphaproteobacteria bacterium]|nr:ABC transporter permease subunit [Alphaproteobacteria bacterium]